MNKRFQILNWRTGSVIFEHEKENNTLKDTLVEAAKKGVNLRGADLRFADLRGADLSGADLRGADLSGADLRRTDLSGADLSGADLCYANLYGADLHGVSLMGADLSGADLRFAYLVGANITNAILHEANLRFADLRRADLRGADTRGADIRYTSIYNAKNKPDHPLACPHKGAFIGWKKVHGRLVKLEIPEDAKRSSATTNKCRCDKAKVLAITDLDGENPITEIENTLWSHRVTYKVGEMVYPDSFDEDRWNECSHGIHFFVDKQDAIDY